MGYHKGIKWKDKPSKQRYFAEGHYLRNKLRRIAKNSGERAASRYDKTYKFSD